MMQRKCTLGSLDSCFLSFLYGGWGWWYGEGQGGRKDQLNPREGEEEGLLHSRCK